jgi:ABC-type Fe3+/spermidine/putrescine transport system ATPase subunit
VKAAEPDAGFYRVSSEVGDLRVHAVETLQAEARVVISIRPEDIRLSESRPQSGNVLQGTVDTKVFLGRCCRGRIRRCALRSAIRFISPWIRISASH